jgi:hypothetical protein
MTSGNVWIERYSRVNDLEVIKRLCHRGAQPLFDLDSISIGTACDMIRAELGEIFIPTKRCCQIILEVVQQAQSHAEKNYPDHRTFLTRAYETDPSFDPWPPILLTGLAGSGKSQLGKAIVRLLGADSTVQVDSGHGHVPLVAVSRISVKAKATLGDILSKLAAPEYSKITGRRNSVASLDVMSTKWQYLIGVCLIILDEMQFLTQSEDANVLIAKVMLRMTYVGPPALIICNYSVLHRLLRRPQEERQRLLTQTTVLLPDSPDSPDWLSVVDEYQKALPGLFDFSFTSAQRELWRLCAGLKRVLVNLVVLAYRQTRLDGRTLVRWVDIEKAYRSTAFSPMREDVELLISEAFNSRQERQDLRCPLPIESTELELYKTALRAIRNQMVSSAAAESALNEKERQAKESLSALRANERSAASTPVDRADTKGRSRTTAEDLIKNANRLRQSK